MLGTTNVPALIPDTLSISLNGTLTATYDGTAAIALNITPASIGAAASSHTHNYAGSSSAGGNANAAVKLVTARKIGNANFDGTANITLAAIGAAAASHTHTKSQITDFPTSLKNPTGLIVKLNGGTTEGTNLFTYDGSAAKTLNITAAIIGAASNTHTHNYAGSSSAAGNANAAVKLATARKIGNANFDGTANITLASIGAAATSHTHTKSQITDFPASLKNPSALTIQLNGVSQGAYDGSAAKTVNITPASIKAAPANLILKALEILTTSWDVTTKRYTYSNSAITANHVPQVFFSSTSIDPAGKAGITAFTEAGKLILEYTTKPTLDLLVEVAILTSV